VKRKKRFSGIKKPQMHVSWITGKTEDYRARATAQTEDGWARAMAKTCA